jgi:hypothetical protein
MSYRKHYVKVSLSDQEVTRLDELRGDEERAVYLRCRSSAWTKGGACMERSSLRPGLRPDGIIAPSMRPPRFWKVGG